MAVPTALDQRSVTVERTPPDEGSTEAPTAHRLRLVLLVVLSFLLVAAVAAVAYLGATRPVPALGVDGEQDSLQTQRESVMAQAEQFMLRINTYGPDQLSDDGTMPDYRKLVEEVITPKFAADFEKNAPLAEATVKQAGLARTAEVFSTGVSAIDSDSATALVAGSITQSYPKKPGSDQRVQTEPAPFRVQVSLVKIKGTWLIDDFQPLTGTDDDQSSGGTGTGTGTELPTPTEGATP
jgi:Mce-associated membrane protein